MKGSPREGAGLSRVLSRGVTPLVGLLAVEAALVLAVAVAGYFLLPVFA